MKLEEKLGHFNKYTMEEARKNYDSIVDTYRNALEQTYKEHMETKIRLEELEYKTETARIVRENNIRFSNDQMKLRMDLIRRQTELKNKLFEEVEEELCRFRSTAAYEELLVRQIRAAVDFARGEKVVIYVDSSDADKVERLESETGASVTVSSYPFGGGMRATLPDRNILIDNSFETRLAEAKENVTIQSRES